MKPVKVGTYELGYERVNLFTQDDFGGRFWTLPKEGGFAEIYVGVASDNWKDVVVVLHHEATEFALTRMNLRYNKSEKWRVDSGGYLFVFTHSEFSQAAEYAAEFMADSWDDLNKA